MSTKKKEGTGGEIITGSGMKKRGGTGNKKGSGKNEEKQESGLFYRQIRELAPDVMIKILIWDVCSGILPFINVLVVADFLDHFLYVGRGGSWKESLQALALLLLCLAFEKLCQARLDFLMIQLKGRLQVKADTMLLEKQTRLSYPCLEQEEVQDLFSRLTAHPSEQILAYIRALRKMLRFVLETGSLWLVLFLQSPVISLVLPLFFVPMLWIAVRCGEMEYDMGEIFWAAMRRVRYLQQLMSGRQHIEEREIFQYSGFLQGKWEGHMEDMVRITARTGRRTAVRITLCKFLALLALGGQMLLLLPSTLRGQMSIGIYIGLTKAAHDLIQKVVWELANLIREIAKGRRYRQDFEYALGLPEEEGISSGQILPGKETGNQAPPAKAVRKIEFQDVTFCYPGSDKAVLCHFSAVFEEKRHYALVGINGAGKSTMLKLLLGIYRDYEGEIRINDTEIRAMETAVLRSYFTVLFQSFARYEITIREQLQLGAGRELSQTECEEALRKAGLQEAVASMPEGIDTVLGKTEANGRELSGGQWQKLAMARCLLREAPVCLMDEPTASIDPMAEAAWGEEIGAIAADQMLIVISHRLGTARKMDEILVLADGRVTEKGRHEELMKQGGLYFQLFETQRSWYDGKGEKKQGYQ